MIRPIPKPKKCCDTDPKFRSHIGGIALDLCRYECPVCGKTTEPQTMPWLAVKEWNDGNYIVSQGKLF